MADKLVVKIKDAKKNTYGVWNETKSKWEFQREWSNKKDAERYTRKY